MLLLMRRMTTIGIGLSACFIILSKNMLLHTSHLHFSHLFPTDRRASLKVLSKSFLEVRTDTVYDICTKISTKITSILIFNDFFMKQHVRRLNKNTTMQLNRCVVSILMLWTGY